MITALSYLLFSSSTLFFSTSAFGFGAHLNSSKILKPGDYDLSGYSQFFSSDRRGAFIATAADLPFTDDTNWRINAGAGSFDFSFGGQLKWVPVKEGEDRSKVSFGATVGADYARDSGIDFYLFKTTPFVSKNLTWEYGSFEPYVAVPLGMIVANDRSDFYSQFIVGSHVRFEELDYMSFAIEGGFDIENSSSYLALMATIQLTQQ